MSDTHPVFKLIGWIQDDMRGVNAKLTELRAHLAAMDLEPASLPACPVCGPISLPPTTSLADHLRVVHDLESEAAA